MTVSFQPWRVEHVDLADGLPDIALDPGVGVFMVVWRGNLPLGHLIVPPGSPPMAPSELTNRIARAVTPAVGHRLFGSPFRPSPPVRRRMLMPPAPLEDLQVLAACGTPLGSLGTHVPDGTVATDSVSVVICTRNRPEHLRACLSSLAEQNKPPLETIVVDNEPGSGATREVVQSFAQAQYVAESRPGLSVARNTGVRAARGDILAFTDDDVRLHPAWLDAMAHAFTDPEVSAATGLILPAELESPAQVAFQLNGEGWGYRALEYDARFFETMSGIGVPVWRIGAGANMAFRRSVFAEVGLFDERLGAGAAGCSEDSELWYRLLADGRRIRYDPAAVVFHFHRKGDEALRGQMYAYMKGHVAALLIQNRHHAQRGNLYRVLVELPSYYLRKVAGRLFRGRRAHALPLAPQIRGGLAGIWYYFKHRHVNNGKKTSSGDKSR